MRDPYTVREERMRKWNEERLLNREKNSKKSGIFGFFSEKNEDDPNELSAKEKASFIDNDILNVDTQPFANSAPLKGLYLYGSPGKPQFSK